MTFAELEALWMARDTRYQTRPLEDAEVAAVRWWRRKEVAENGWHLLLRMEVERIIAFWQPPMVRR